MSESQPLFGAARVHEITEEGYIGNARGLQRIFQLRKELVPIAGTVDSLGVDAVYPAVQGILEGLVNIGARLGVGYATESHALGCLGRAFEIRDVGIGNTAYAARKIAIFHHYGRPGRRFCHARHEHVVMVRLVGDDGQAQLLEVVGAGGLASLVARLAQRRQQHLGQDGDDRDHDEQLNEGEGFLFHWFLQRVANELTNELKLKVFVVKLKIFEGSICAESKQFPVKVDRTETRHFPKFSFSHPITAKFLCRRLSRWRFS